MNAWGRTGNAGTVSGTDFIGTTDNVAFNIRVANVKSGRIDHTLSGSTSFGYNTLSSPNLTGVRNTAFGANILQANTTGSNNAAIGKDALFRSTTGEHNTALGTTSLYFNTSGTGNTAAGWNALIYNGTGNYNTGVGVNSIYNNVSGNYNTGVGYSALSAPTIGNNNTAIGYSSFVNAPQGITNSTAVGANAQVTASNMIRLGDTVVTRIEGQVPFTAASDFRLKENINNLDSGSKSSCNCAPSPTA